MSKVFCLADKKKVLKNQGNVKNVKNVKSSGGHKAKIQTHKTFNILNISLVLSTLFTKMLKTE